MKKKRQIIKKIILILCLILTLNQHMVLAATEAEFQNTIASFCWNFYQKSGAETRYMVKDFSYRERAYKDIKVDGYYQFDCVGWVSFAIHHALGMGNEDFTYFAVPTGCNPLEGANGFNNRIMYKSESDLKPGDILQSYEHVMVYVGDIDNSGKGTIIHCTGHGGAGGPANGTDAGWGVKCEYFKDSSYFNIIESFCRIEPDVLAGLDASQFNPNGDLLSVGTNGSSNNNESNINMADFYYNGIPNGKYSVTKGFLERLIEALSEIFDYLIGIITMCIRMVFVGWTAIFENLLTFTITTITGGDDIESISVTSTDIESGDNITIEKIVFNQISVFDVNFFNFNDEIEDEEDEIETQTN